MRGAGWVAVVLCVAACGPPRQQVVAHLIERTDEAARILDPAAELVLSPTWGAATTGEAASASWSFFRSEGPAPVTDGGIDLAPLRADDYLLWHGELRAADLAVVRVRFRQPLQGAVEMFWNSVGEDFGPQRYAIAWPDEADQRSVSFELASHRSWRGTLVRIGIRPLGVPVSGQALTGIEGLRRVAPPTMGGGETVRVTIDGISSRAWLARPQTTICRAVPARRGARLRLLAAAWVPPGAAFPVRVVERSPRGRHVLLETRMVPDPSSASPLWSRHDVALRQPTAGGAELCFETGAAPEGALMVWGEPRVVAMRRDRRPNVVLVSLDTVRADHLSLYGYRRPTTPNLDAWARRRATVFETAVVSAPWTLPSHVSLFTGVEAVHHGVNRRGPIPPAMRLLPQRFRDAGYATYATTAGVLLTPELGFARGFDELRVRGTMASLTEWSEELADGIDEAVRWVSTHRDERFFLFFHTYEPHTPYQAREPWFSRFGGDPAALNAGLPVWEETAGSDHLVRPRSNLFHPPTWAEGSDLPKRVLGPADRPVAAALYDSGLAYTDAQLSLLLGRLETEGLMEETVVVVTSDHGEALFEHGLVGHGSLYDHDLLVPLVVAAPHQAPGGRVGAQVRSVDVAPTLLELAGLEVPEGIDGRSLLPLLRGDSEPPRPALAYARSTVRGIALRWPGRKLVVGDTIFPPMRDEVELYDLREDPGELHNLAAGADLRDATRRLRGEVRPGEAAIELRVVNRGVVAIEGVLGGSLVDGMMTSAALTFPCCASSGEGVQLRSPPGSDYTLLLQDAPPGTLRVKLRRGGAAFDGTFEMDEAAGRQRVVWSDRGWRRNEAGGGEGWSGVELRRLTPRAGRELDDEEMQRRLRALGYVQ